jgi:hypothetical protein
MGPECITYNSEIKKPGNYTVSVKTHLEAKACPEVAYDSV